MTLMMRNCCEVLIFIWIIHIVLTATVILIIITLIHVYNNALPDHVLLHHALYVLVSIPWDVSFEAIVLNTIFGPPKKSLARQIALHIMYSIAHAQLII